MKNYFLPVLHVLREINQVASDHTENSISLEYIVNKVSRVCLKMNKAK